jgi:hypothetical protein
LARKEPRKNLAPLFRQIAGGEINLILICLLNVGAICFNQFDLRIQVRPIHKFSNIIYDITSNV